MLLASVHTAQASTSRRLTLVQLVGASSTIVVATCRSTVAQWTPDRTQIETVATYDVIETLKGSTVQSFTVVSLGGEVDGIGMHVSGMPAFERGRRELLFLTRSKSAAMKVVGMAQGQFEITIDSTGASLIGRRTNGTALLGPVDPALNTRRLDSLTSSVRRQIGA